MTLPKDIFDGLDKLQVLSLYLNRLNSLDLGTFSCSSSLNELQVGKNNLTCSKHIFGLENLQTLTC